MLTRTSIQCPRCGNRFEAAINTVIDASSDPEAKMRLLGGRSNTVQCPNCGTPVTVAIPMVYHDAAKELLITFVPIELNMPKDRQEKVVGDLIREVTNSLPPEGRKGYLFNPRSALTMQGLIDQVLQADGVTPEMMEAQRAKVRLVEMFVQASEDDLPNLVQQYDDQIDAQFFQLMTVMAQRMAQEGRADIAQHVLEIQQVIAEHSTLGQELMAQAERQDEVVREVAEDVRALGNNATRADFIDLAFRYVDDPDRIQALVRLARPAFDAALFQEMTARIAQAPADQRDALEDMRDQMMQLVAVLDQQTQMAVQEAAQLLQMLLSSPQPEAIIRENVELIDDTFMAVLGANIQEAERQGDINASARLKDLYNRVVNILRDNMQPELRFINELLSMTSEDDARAAIQEQAVQYGPRLLEMMDAVEGILESRGDTQILNRLAWIRETVEEALSNA
jgi:hypothetical protein